MSKNIMVFSRSGVHYADKGRSDALALFVSSREQTRQFTDIGTINTSSVKERYGDIQQIPLWRQEGGTVVVYGLLPKNIQERRHGLEVFLPEDFAPDGTSVFYYVFPKGVVIHGVRNVNDDGSVSWGISRFNNTSTDALNSILVQSISERIASGMRENICVAVHDDKIYSNIVESLEPLSQNVIRFSELSPAKIARPLYVHRDHGLVYVIFAMVALILLVASIISAVTSRLELSDLRDDITNIERQIKETKSTQRLGNVGNPNEILDFIKRPLKQRPSSVIHAVGEVASILGEVKVVEVETRRVSSSLVKKVSDTGNVGWAQESVLPIKVIVEGGEKYLLVDQERVAESTLKDRPWIRYIERSGSGATGQSMVLEIGVKID